MLAVSDQTIYRMIEDGTLKAYKLRPDKENSPWHVNYDSVIAHLERIHEINGLEKRFGSEAERAKNFAPTNSGTALHAPDSASTRR